MDKKVVTFLVAITIATSVLFASAALLDDRSDVENPEPPPESDNASETIGGNKTNNTNSTLDMSDGEDSTDETGNQTNQSETPSDEITIDASGGESSGNDYSEPDTEPESYINGTTNSTVV